MVFMRTFATCAILLALACSTKQFAWEFVPFYLLYVGRGGSLIERTSRLKRPLLLFGATFGLIVLPWIISSPHAFAEDVLAFQSGLLPDSYPIRGVGFSTLVLRAGVVGSNTASFPFWMFQVAFGLPVFAALLYGQVRSNTLRRAVVNYVAGLTVFLFFSRAFNGNYVGYLAEVLALAVLMDDPPERPRAHEDALAAIEIPAVQK